jgi:hypothetical protein
MSGSPQDPSALHIFSARVITARPLERDFAPCLVEEEQCRWLPNVRTYPTALGDGDRGTGAWTATRLRPH